jgi:3-oxoacyl-[acyl-carrier protein] reductase
VNAQLLPSKVALVTGSTRGIGWEIAQLFAAHGAQVILNGRSDQEQIDSNVHQIHSTYGVEAIGLRFDVSDSTAVQSAYQTIFKKFKKLDILVNNAGILEDALLGMIPTDSANRIFSINALGVLNNIQAAARLMSRQKAGTMINLTSIIGSHGNAGQVAYSGSKAAVIGMTLSAAKELASVGIRVNAIAPGFIETDMVRQIPAAKFQERLSSIKMGRIGQPREVANVALFLASDLASYVTGQVIGVDGGMLI